MAKTLKRQTLEGIGWRGSVDITEQILQIVFTAILARLLTKADFGLVAMALLVNRFFTTVTNVGFGGAIIRSQNVTQRQISAVFFIQLGLNIILSITVFLIAGAAANFFNEIKLTEIIKVTAWIILLQTFQFPNILLQKDMDFKRFSIMEISSMVIANLAAIVLALTGFGYWALVGRLLLQRAVFSATTWYVTRWRPVKPDFRGIKPLMTFGLNMLGSHIVYFFSENLIGILTGRMLGKEIMGLFNIAYNLAIVPATKIRGVLTTVLMPGFSKIQDNLKSFKHNNKKALLYTSIIFIPFMFWVSGASENIVVTLYGTKWSDAGIMLMILAYVGVLKGISHLLRSTILAKGYAKIILISTIIEISLSIPIMYFTLAKLGIIGLMIGYFVGGLAGFFFIISQYNKLFGKERFFYKTVKAPFLIGGLIFIVTGIFYLFDGNNYLELFCQLTLGFTLFFFLSKYFYAELVEELFNKLKMIYLRMTSKT